MIHIKGCYAELRSMCKRLLNVERIELQVVDKSMVNSIEETLVHQKTWKDDLPKLTPWKLH